MMHIKPVPLLDPHATRNQCKLIWDSTSGPRHRLSAKHKVASSGKKVGFSVGSVKNASFESGANKKVRFVEGSSSEIVNTVFEKRSSLVAARISFYEEKREINPDTNTDIEVKISFDDHATTTFEYDDEELALEKYLEEHPEEREEALRQEEEVNGDIGGPTEDLLNERIPMEPEPTMKSNTVLGTSGGGLTSYKSKIQTQEFQFGMRPEPEVVEDVPEPELEDEPQNLDLLPADDAETDMFSAELDKPDMLF